MTTLAFGPNTITFQRYDENAVVTVPLARLFLIGRTERGPVGVPTVVTDAEDFVSKFGRGTQATGTDRLYGELEAYRSRVGDLSDAVVLRLYEGSTATGTAKDGSTGKLSIEAGSAGVWGNALSRSVVTSADSLTATVTVREMVNGVAQRIRTVTAPVSAEGVATMNAALGGLATVKWNALGTGVALNSTLDGAAVTWVNLTGGADSASFTEATLRGGINADTQERTGLATLRTTEHGGGVIIAEGVATDTMRAAMYEFARDFERVYLDGPQTDILPSAAEVEKAALELLSGASFATYTYPRARVGQAPGTYTRSALGWVAGEMVAGVMQTPGMVRPPAGRTLIPDVQRSPNGRDTLVHDSNASRLKARGINVLILRGGQVELEGLSLLRADLLQPSIDKVYERLARMAITYDLGPRLSRFNNVYVDKKGAFFNVVKGAIRDTLKPYYQSGVLYGATLEEAFDVKLDFELNPPTTLERTGRVLVRVKYKVSPVSEGIDLALFQIPITAAF